MTFTEMTNIEDQDIDKHKAEFANCLNSIKFADSPFSRNTEIVDDDPFFFCSTDYIFDDNQIQISFCKHGNYYHRYFVLRYSENDWIFSFNKKIYCNKCIEPIDKNTEPVTDNEFEVDSDYSS